MKLLLDTHFLVWVVTDHPRMDAFGWMEDQGPWGVSPVSLLEVKYLSEVGRLRLHEEPFLEALGQDPRFVLDEVPLLSLVRQALPLEWTRDPFDRLLVAHSLARRVAFCTLDREIRAHHSLLPRELAAEG